jgi:hypothetical protein
MTMGALKYKDWVYRQKSIFTKNEFFSIAIIPNRDKSSLIYL